MKERTPTTRNAKALDHPAGDGGERLSAAMSRYHDIVRGLVYRMGVRAPEDNEDVVQEVFLKVHESAHRYRDGYGTAPWIMGIARNVTRMWLRRRRRDPVTVLPSVDRVVIDERPAHAVEDLLDRLPPRVRRVVEERYLHGRTYREVAKTLGLSEDQVDLALRKAKAIAQRWQSGRDGSSCTDWEGETR